MATMTRWIAPVVFAAGFGAVAMAPAPAHAQSGDDLARVIVDVADVIFRSGQPYYRYGNYGYNDRLIVDRDRYGRPVYYRYAPRQAYRSGPPYGKAHGYWRKQQARNGAVRCDSRGRCETRYYDPRYDRRYDARYDGRYDNRYYGYRDNDRYWDGRRWRDRDDD